MILLKNAQAKELLEKYPETEYENLPKTFKNVYKSAFGIKCNKCNNIKNLWNYVDFNSIKCNNCIKKEKELKLVMEALREMKI